MRTVDARLIFHFWRIDRGLLTGGLGLLRIIDLNSRLHLNVKLVVMLESNVVSRVQTTSIASMDCQGKGPLAHSTGISKPLVLDALSPEILNS